MEKMKKGQKQTIKKKLLGKYIVAYVLQLTYLKPKCVTINFGRLKKKSSNQRLNISISTPFFSR